MRISHPTQSYRNVQHQALFVPILLAARWGGSLVSIAWAKAICCEMGKSHYVANADRCSTVDSIVVRSLTQFTTGKYG